MRIASFRMASASSTLQPSQRSPISLLPLHFPLASRPNEQNEVDQFNLPSAFDLDADIIGVMAAGCAEPLNFSRSDKVRARISAQSVRCQQLGSPCREKRSEPKCVSTAISTNH